MYQPEQIIHKALASDIRRQILLCLAKKEKYLSEISVEVNKKPQTIDFHLSLLEEIGFVQSDWREGKKYYSLKDKKILVFLREKKSVPHQFRPRPPHEIMIEAWKDIVKRLDKIDKKLDELDEKIK